MNVIFTYCSFNEGKELDKFFFKISLLSITQAKRCIEDAHTILYCDKYSKDFFSRIPALDRIEVVDYSSYDFDERFWCFPKFISYSMQNEPFIHIDLDLALMKKVDIPKVDIISERLREFDKEPAELVYLDTSLPVPDSIYCSGIYGGYNVAFFKEFFSYAKSICSKANLKDKQVLYEHLYSLEEGYVTQVATKRNYDIWTFPEKSFKHFWQRPKSQYYEIINDYIITLNII